jgi:D-alanyl-D-alanine carboxypeptidase
MDSTQAELDRLVDGGLPGAFVYLKDGDGTARFWTAGVADLDTGARMTPTSHYRIGSTTKTFTAVVVVQLIGEGRLALDDLIQERLPDLPIPNGDRLTVEHLLRMRSGLFDFEDDPSLVGNLEAHLRPVSLAHVNELAVRGPTKFLPGQRFEYCNSNFCLLEAIVERVMGRGLGDEMRERIFEPLGLSQTTYPEEDDLSLPEPYIRGYDRTDDGWRECSIEFFGRGDGAIVSTAADVARFFRALLVERTLLASDLLELMMSEVPDAEPTELKMFGVSTPVRYGLGLFSHPIECGTVWGHSGGGYGYVHAPFVRLDTGRIAIVMRSASFGFHKPAYEGMARRLSMRPKFRWALYCT